MEGEELLEELHTYRIKSANLDCLWFYATHRDQYPEEFKAGINGEKLYVFYPATKLQRRPNRAGQRDGRIFVGYTAWDEWRKGLEVDLFCVHNCFFQNSPVLYIDDEKVNALR